MTGCLVSGSNSAELASVEADATSSFDDDALQTRGTDPAAASCGYVRNGSRRACPRCRGCRIRRGSERRRRHRARPALRLAVSQSSDGTHEISTLDRLRESTGAQRLGDREVCVGQVDVLADQRDTHGLTRLVDTIEQVAPHGPVDVAERETELANDVGVEALTVQNLRDVVDRRERRASRCRRRRPRRTSARSCS